MKLKYLASLIIILFFALSGCGGQAEYIEYQEEVSPEDVVVAEPQAPTLCPVEPLPAEPQPPAYTPTETPPLEPDIFLSILQDVTYRDGLIHVLDNDGRRGLLSREGKVLVPLTEGLTFGSYGEGRILATTDAGKSGFIDTLTGEWAIAPKFSIASYAVSRTAFRYGEATLRLVDRQQGIINHGGEWVFGPVPRGQWTRGRFQHGISLMTRQQYQDSRGNWVTFPREESQPFIINTAGERVFPLEHMEIYHYNGWMSIRIEGSNLVQVETDGYIKLFDLEGNKLVYFEKDDAFFYRNITVQDDVIIVFYTNLLCQSLVDTTMEFRVFDLQGSEITSRYYTNIGRFVEGFAPVEVGRPDLIWYADAPYLDDVVIWDEVFWGLIDKQGNEVIPPIHWHVSNVVQGLVQTYSPRGFALLNTAGEYVIPFGEFESIAICDQGVVIVGIGGIGTSPSDQLKGLLDLEGNEIIPPRYNIIRSYWTYENISNGWEYLLIEAGTIAPSRWGDFVVQSAINKPTFVEGRAAVAYGELWGYIDINGNEIIPLQFVYAGTFMDGLALVNIGGTRARPHTWQASWRSRIDDTRHYSAFGGTWHLIDLYGNIVETFEHEFMKRVNTNVFAFSDDVSLSEVYDRYAWLKQAPQHRGGRFTPLWVGDEFIGVVDECVYITFVQMDFEGLGIFVIE